jgi:hypothetical protein
VILDFDEEKAAAGPRFIGPTFSVECKMDAAREGYPR